MTLAALAAKLLSFAGLTTVWARDENGRLYEYEKGELVEYGDDGAIRRIGRAPKRQPK